MSYKTLVVLLVAAMDALWVQEVSGGLVGDIFSTHDTSKTDESAHDRDSLFGTHDIKIGNTYPENTEGKNLFGSQDVQIGNVYPENSQGTNTYGPTLIQRGNVYKGSGGNSHFGASVTQIGNVYPKTLGKGDTFAPVIVQEDNVYSLKNLSENTVFGAVVNQTNNTYPKALEGNKETLKPVIIQRGNVFLESPGKNNAGGVVNQNDNRSHPTQGHKWTHGTATDPQVGRPLLTIGMMKRQHEEMKRIIDFHIHTHKSSSKICANGMMGSEWLDRIISLKHEVETEVTLLNALLQINQNRKLICESITAQCAKHDEARKWISSTKLILSQKTEKSRGIWMNLRTC